MEKETKTPMTIRGIGLLQDELNYLKNVERPNIILAIAEARGHGDLSENAEYHSAKEKQSQIERKINMFEEKLQNAMVVDVTSLKSDSVKFGATVTIFDEDEDKTLKFQIVGIDESDVKAGLISFTSPIARAMIGKKKDDLVEVNIPTGLKKYYIEKVEYI